LNEFYNRRTNTTYIFLSIGSLILTEVIFAFAWEGGYEKSLLNFCAFLTFSLTAFNSFFFFKNLINGNRNIKGGFIGGVTVLLVILALLFSLAMTFI
jgi:hypothetical protein